MLQVLEFLFVKLNMAMDMKAAGIVPWKVQCQMSLMKEGLWSIVNGSESGPTDKALATIVFFVDPSLLYLIGDSENPVLVWKKLGDQFKMKTWLMLMLPEQCQRQRLDMLKSTKKLLLSLGLVSNFLLTSWENISVLRLTTNH